MQRSGALITLIVLVIWLQNMTAAAMPGDQQDSLLAIAQSGISREAAIAWKDLAKAVPDSLSLHMQFANNGLKIAQAINDNEVTGNIFMNMGVVQDIAGNMETAIAYFDSARMAFEHLDDNQEWMETLFINYGTSYYYNDQLSIALDYYLKAYEWSTSDATNNGTLLNNIAAIYEKLEKFPQAIHYYKKSLSSKDGGDPITYYNTISNLAQTYAQVGKTDSALYYLDKAERGFRNSGADLDVIIVHVQKARVLNQAGKYSAAKEEMELFLPGIDEMRISRQIEAFQVAADICHNLGMYSKAITLYQSAVPLIQEHDMTFTQEAIYHGLAQSYAAAGQYDLAFQIMMTSRELLKNKLSLDRLNLEQEMQVKFNTLQKEAENQQLLLTNELQQLNIRRARRNTLLATLGMLILAALLGLIYRQQRIQSRLNRKLERQKSALTRALSDKELLLKEIHHRVKNNLQVISSLLGIQSRQINDPAALDAIRQGRARVQSMSLIHQDLYRGDELKGISIQSYFEKLSQSLFTTYNLNPKAIQLTADIDDLVLDVDTLVPLGLILNELISNALKYAFPEGKGHIHVSLKETKQGIQLSVHDNGQGIDQPEQLLGSDSFGYDLIRSLVNKMDGELEILSENGTLVNTLLKSYQKVA